MTSSRKLADGRACLPGKYCAIPSQTYLALPVRRTPPLAHRTAAATYSAFQLHLCPAAMDLHAKIRTLPTLPGCYLYKNAEGEVIYVGKAKNLRARVRSYFLA